MHAVMTFARLAGNRPICHVNQRSLAIAFLPKFSHVAWWYLSVSWESSQTPNHRGASLFKGTVLASTATVAVGGVFLLWTIAASGFPWSKASPLFAAQPIEADAGSDSFAVHGDWWS